MYFQKGMLFKWQCQNGTKTAEIIELGRTLVKFKTRYLGLESELYFSKDGLIKAIDKGQIIRIGACEDIRWLQFGKQIKLSV